MAVALFILERRVVKALKRKGEPRAAKNPWRGIDIDGADLRGGGKQS